MSCVSLKPEHPIALATFFCVFQTVYCLRKYTYKTLWPCKNGRAPAAQTPKIMWCLKSRTTYVRASLRANSSTSSFPVVKIPHTSVYFSFAPFFCTTANKCGLFFNSFPILYFTEKLKFFLFIFNSSFITLPTPTCVGPLELSNLGPVLIIIHTELGISANQKKRPYKKKDLSPCKNGRKIFRSWFNKTWYSRIYGDALEYTILITRSIWVLGHIYC